MTFQKSFYFIKEGKISSVTDYLFFMDTDLKEFKIIEFNIILGMK